MHSFPRNPARRLVVAIIPTDHFAGRGELRGVSAVAASRGWSLETIDTALFGRDLAPFLPREELKKQMFIPMVDEG